jgi:hypothetical protein
MGSGIEPHSSSNEYEYSYEFSDNTPDEAFREVLEEAIAGDDVHNITAQINDTDNGTNFFMKQ